MNDWSWDKSFPEYLSDQQDRYESRVVRHIAKRLGLNKLLVQLEEETRSRTGDPATCLPLEAFVHAAGLPIWLRAQKLTYLDNLESDFYKRPTKTTVFKAFCDASEMKPPEYSIAGLVFWWPGYSSFFVMHDSQTWPEKARAGRFWTAGRPPKRYWLQTLDELIDEFEADCTIERRREEFEF